MGAGASVEGLDEEVRKPKDAADVDTPRGFTARSEVSRLRGVLSVNFKSAQLVNGGQSTAGAWLEDEVGKPMDGGDVDSPRSAKAEVRRLRELLSSNYNAVQNLILNAAFDEGGSAVGAEADYFGQGALDQAARHEMASLGGMRDLEDEDMAGDGGWAEAADSDMGGKSGLSAGPSMRAREKRGGGGKSGKSGVGSGSGGPGPRSANRNQAEEWANRERTPSSDADKQLEAEMEAQLEAEMKMESDEHEVAVERLTVSNDRTDIGLETGYNAGAGHMHMDMCDFDSDDDWGSSSPPRGLDSKPESDNSPGAAVGAVSGSIISGEGGEGGAARKGNPSGRGKGIFAAAQKRAAERQAAVAPP